MEAVNVLCITMRFSYDDPYSDQPIKWHQPLSGLAIIKRCDYSIDSVRRLFDVTTDIGFSAISTLRLNGIVEFQGVNYEMLYIRPGFNGSCLTIGVKKEVGKYDLWEFYTDTPICFRFNYTPEGIRQIAEQAIRR